MKGMFEMKMKSKLLILSVVVATAGFLPQSKAQDVNLETANNFGVLAGSAVTVAGLPSTINGGSVGVAGGSAIGLLPSQVNGGSLQSDTAVAILAQNNLGTAYTTAAGLGPVTSLGIGPSTQLGGLVLTPGIYSIGQGAQITGTLTLNYQGNPDALFVFQIGSTLITASGGSVAAINDPNSSTAGISTYWQVGKSATLGTGTQFQGNILAYASITDDGGSTVDGRLLAETAAVNLNDTTVNVLPAEPQVVPVPEPSTLIAALLLLPVCAGTIRCAFRRKQTV